MLATTRTRQTDAQFGRFCSYFRGSARMSWKSPGPRLKQGRVLPCLSRCTCIDILCFIVLLLYCLTALLFFAVLPLYCFTALLLYCFTALLLYRFTVLLLYCFTALLFYCFTALLFYCFTVLLLYCFTVLPVKESENHINSVKICFTRISKPSKRERESRK